jgi:ketosteroid isomerase-like protein
MSQENVEIARRAFDAWNRGDTEAWIEAWDEQAEFRPMRAQLEGDAYRGHAGLRRFVAEMSEEWEGFRFEVEEIRDAGEPLVATGRVKARGRVSGVDLDVPLALVGSARGGKIAFVRLYSSPGEALQAAGLSE